MENNIVISFIIPAHNSEKFLKRCVESVVKEEKQPKDNMKRAPFSTQIDLSKFDMKDFAKASDEEKADKSRI